MPHNDSDSNVWIGYSDFLTTLVVLFFVLLAIQLTSKPATLAGLVVDAGGRGQPGCLVEASLDGTSQREERTDSMGQFIWDFDVPDSLRLRILAECQQLPTVDTTATLYPGATIRLALTVGTSAVPGDSTMTIESVPGDALFERNEWWLTPEGIERVREVGQRLRQRLETSGGVIAVQGHTDSIPFPAGVGTDNWRLSVNRAASAAEILRDPRYGVNIPECQLVVMGFGPTRPDPTANTYSEQRRIEFRLLQGADLTGTNRPDCGDNE